MLITPANNHLTTVEQWAEQLGAGSFLNAFLREWNDWHFLPEQEVRALHPEARVAIEVPLQQQSLTIFIRHFSLAGRHQFFYPYGLRDQSNSGKKAISTIHFMALVERLANNSLWDTSPSNRALFVERVARSVSNTVKALEARTRDLGTLYTAPLSFEQSEQSLLAGHAIHPTPKSHEQMSDAEAQRFIPEYGQSFALHWFSIESKLLDSDSTHTLSFTELVNQLVQEDDELNQWLIRDVPDHHTLIPAHPWQARQWMTNQWLKQLIQEGRMVSYGESGTHWRATTSVRSIYAPHASFMLKFSLSVHLTNSLRHLLPKEVIRGKEIHEVKYNSAIGEAFHHRYPDFDILTEPAHGAIKGPDGQVMPETMIVFRENPFSDNAVKENTEVLAALTQDNPSGESRIIHMVRQLATSRELTVNEAAEGWFNHFLRKVIEPLCVAQADYGLLFGAHQQNLLIHLQDNLPERAWFRDCQGTGYSQQALDLLNIQPKETSDHTEHYVNEEMEQKLFIYYLMVNSTLGVISAMGAAADIDESRLLFQLRLFLETLKVSGLNDTRCIDELLNSRTLWSKGNFYCTFHRINENTLKDPLALYHRIPNPLFEHSR